MLSGQMAEQIQTSRERGVKHFGQTVKEGGAENVGLPVTGIHLEFWTPIPRVSHFNKKNNFNLLSWIVVRLGSNITDIFFPFSSTGTLIPRGSKSANIVKCGNFFLSDFYDVIFKICGMKSRL